MGVFLSIFFFALALFCQRQKNTATFSFTFFVLAAVSFSMSFPERILTWGTFETKQLIVPLLQIIMFGMGTTMGLSDFSNVIKMPKGVLIGLLCQFTIMPIVGYSIGALFQFPAEITAGIILIGSCPGGLASNVMAYLAKANVALSITLTTIATVIAPFITPVLMNIFAGELIPINKVAMMISICKMVILPVILGVGFNYIAKERARGLFTIMPKVSMFAILFIIMIITANGQSYLQTIGISLFFAAIMHNTIGYFMGYWGARLSGLSEKDCRTIAFEVGMQNGGLASGIAVEMGRVSSLGLAAAIFGPWMNVSGSVLAMWWKGRDPESIQEPSAISSFQEQ